MGHFRTGHRLLAALILACAVGWTGRAQPVQDAADTLSTVLEYGLSVVSYPSAAQDYSGVTLEGGKPIPLRRKPLELSFDIYNRPDNVFGCVFRILTDSGENIDLMYTVDLDDRRYPILVTGDEVHEIPCAIPLEEWIPVKITLNPKDGQVDVDYGGTLLQLRDAGTKGAKAFRIAFGLCQFAGYTLSDVASVNLRDIRIRRGDRLVRQWELARHAGDICYDEMAGAQAVVKNPQWLIDQYVSFRPVFSHTFEDIPSVTFDDYDGFYMADGDEPIHVWHADTDEFTEIPVAGGHNPANYPNQLFYVAGSHQWLTAFNLDEGLFSTFDFDTRRWNNDVVPTRDHDYWNNTNTWEPEIHALYSFGGYGHYHYRNELIVSYLEHPELNRRAVLEDITPRYAMTSYIVDSLLYVFGGRGNPSGKQELSPKNYYDLYTVDTRDFSVRKLWDLEKSPFGDFISSENFVYNWANGDFYLLSDLDGFTLLKLRPEAPGLEKMSLPIPPKRNAQYIYLNLWHSYAKDKLYALVLQAQVDNRTDVDIYEINYPPLPVSTILQEGREEPVSGKGGVPMWLLALACAAALASGIFFGLRGVFKHYPELRKKKGATEVEETYAPTVRYYDFGRSSVNFFGGFRVMDKDGKDITGQFTPTLKSLLILLILHTQQSQGIASQRINNLLWSYKMDDTANNNRNVYMSKLRGLLEEVGDVRIQNQNKLWSIDFGEGVACDYLEACRLFGDGAAGEDVDRLLELLLRGPMLPNTELDWVDGFKSAFSNHTIDFLCRQLRRKDLPDVTLLQAANTIFQHDFLNEDALRAKVSILRRQNKTGLAKTVYDSFCKEYRKSLGVDYSVPFKELI
jgi:DNA-binding SARP family transcriptional activator